jgi:hypothetical protein
LLESQRMEQTTRQKLWHGVAAGTIATFLMTALLVSAPTLVGVRLPEAVARVATTLRARPLLVLVALGFHFGYGALAGALFTVAARRTTLAAGLSYGFVLWGVAVAVYAPLVGLGFLTSHEPALAALALPAHLLYGAALGALAPRGEIVQPINDRLPLTLADG